VNQPTPQERWDAAGKARDGGEAYDLLYSAWPEPKTTRLFRLERDTDVSGISGTGTVADGVVWPDGTVTLRWRGERPSTVNWNRVEDVEAINGHGGATRIVYADNEVKRVVHVVRLEGPTSEVFAGPFTGGEAEAWIDANRTPAWTMVQVAPLERPAVIPEHERLVRENPELAQQIREGIAEAGRGETVDLGGFSQYLDGGDGDDD